LWRISSATIASRHAGSVIFASFSSCVPVVMARQGLEKSYRFQCSSVKTKPERTVAHCP